MAQVVIDASFALASVLPDERAGRVWHQLLSGFRGGEVDLTAPSVWEYEVANALRLSVARGRLTEQWAGMALRSLLGLGVALWEFAPIAGRAWDLALEHQLTVHDAAYLALAQRQRCYLYTGDKRLGDAARHLGLLADLGEAD